MARALHGFGEGTRGDVRLRRLLPPPTPQEPRSKTCGPGAQHATTTARRTYEGMPTNAGGLVHTRL
eukprot:6886623-Lingulodinium_polyedra.AAC.1